MFDYAEIVIEVFATNVESKNNTARLCNRLQVLYPHGKINFDLHDKDRVLRVEGIDLSTSAIIKIVKDAGFKCAPLE